MQNDLSLFKKIGMINIFTVWQNCHQMTAGKLISLDLRDPFFFHSSVTWNLKLRSISCIGLSSHYFILFLIPQVITYVLALLKKTQNIRLWFISIHFPPLRFQNPKMNIIKRRIAFSASEIYLPLKHRVTNIFTSTIYERLTN